MLSSTEDNRALLRTAIGEAIKSDSVTQDELMRALSILMQQGDEPPVTGITKKQPKPESARSK